MTPSLGISIGRGHGPEKKKKKQKNKTATPRPRHTPQSFWAPGLLGGFVIIYLQSVLEWVLKQQVNFIELIIFFAIIGYLKKNARLLLPPSPVNPSPSEPVAETAT